MESLYNILIRAADRLLPFGGLLGDKMKLFSEGRKDIFPQLQRNISSTDRSVWIHAASLGEFEQAVPVIEQLKKDFPHYKIVVSFFSPSGYEIKKNSPLADVITYLPLDTRKNAEKFMDLVHPEWAILALVLAYNMGGIVIISSNPGFCTFLRARGKVNSFSSGG